MRLKVLLCLLLVALAGVGVYYAAYVRTRAARVEQPTCAGRRTAQLEQAACELSKRVPVANNRGPMVPDGFQGEVHPLLHRHIETEVRAYWEPEKVQVGDLLPGLPVDLDDVRHLYLGVSVAVPAKSYTERDFSSLLPPENVNTAGQLWALDPERIALFLKQFHPSVSMHGVSVGRRPGPDGAFALLRGVSSSYLDIVFRVHAEFDLAPKTCHFSALYVWYTPAYFLGRILVNRHAGTVEYFQLSVPTDEVKNIHGTVWTTPDYDHPKGYGIYQFLRANRMELVGGSLKGFNSIQWAEQIETARVHDQLAKVFYKFKEIDFLPFPQALAAARMRKKPIFAVVPLGSLDDQSC